MRGGALVFILFCDLVVEILNCHHYRPIRDFLIFPAMQTLEKGVQGMTFSYHVLLLVFDVGNQIAKKEKLDVV